MRIVIDIVISAILLYCVWRGMKRGVISELVCVLIILTALCASAALASKVPADVTVTMKPFVSGVVEAQGHNAAMEALGLKEKGLSITEAMKDDPDALYNYCRECLIQSGIHENNADDLALRAAKLAEKERPTEAVVDEVCEAAAFVISMLLIFIIIIVIMSVAVNMLNLQHSLENEKLDLWGGAALGLLYGMVLSLFLCWLLSFCGIIIGRTTLDDGLLSRFFMLFEPITDIII